MDKESVLEYLAAAPLAEAALYIQALTDRVVNELPAETPAEAEADAEAAGEAAIEAVDEAAEDAGIPAIPEDYVPKNIPVM